VRIFVDTSALLALLDASQPVHGEATNALIRLADEGVGLVTHNYVIVEANALVQRRLGMDALNALHRDVLSAIDVVMVDRALHDAATTAQLAAGRRQVSFVDWVSFEMMRREQIESAFAFDQHFAEQGFELVTP
jgi:predicted nucleic acid-binding protein